MITIVCDSMAHDGRRGGHVVLRLKRDPAGGWGVITDGTDMDDTFLLRGEKAQRQFLDGDRRVGGPEAATRLRYRIECSCGDSVPARAEHLHPILDTLLASGWTRPITLTQLRYRLANRARGGSR
ncbi:hypothetical protein A5705_04865 [Mycobacterium sp. E787]|nr:hypothetical protein A5705_04865 [Mycobacterium sp. E787]